ncbi:major facilitator superfamily domain-containing protein 6-like [Brachionichthys hirsutus]|uniref:major facilitator superfamily domain-containing protein 6-like n=1 Tax=Brachionichthys hirsutus TaxID=412623 RepID=UPI003604D864
MARNKQIDIKRALALAGTFNFLRCWSAACLLPFFTLYLRQLGLTPAMTGIVMGTKHLLTLVWSPLASLLSKHYDKRRAVIVCSLVCSTAAVLLLLLIPPADVNAKTAACNASGPSAASTHGQGGDPVTNSTGPAGTKPPLAGVVAAAPAKTPPETGSAPGTIPLPGLKEETPSPRPSQEDAPAADRGRTAHSAAARSRRSRSGGPQEGGGFLGSLNALDTQHQVFFLVLLTVAVWASASAPLEWTADDGLYDYLDYADASDRYGSTGPWDLLGAACGVGGVGVLVSQLSCLVAGRGPRSAVHFYCHAAVAALALPVAMYLPLYLNKKRDRAGGLLKALRLVRGSPRALLCGVTTLLAGAAGSNLDNFLLWQMQDHGSSELHMGLALALALLSQAAFPLLAGGVAKLLSPGRALAVGAASLGLQCLYCSFLWGPWAALPAQLLSCFSGGALWWAVALQCEDVATPGAERSVRRVYGQLCVHLGGGLGSFAGGFVAQRFGLAWLFRGVAVGLALWGACLLLLQWKAPRQRRINYSRLLAADGSEASDSESEQERDWLDKAMEVDKSNNNNNNYYGRRTSSRAPQ